MTFHFGTTSVFSQRACCVSGGEGGGLQVRGSLLFKELNQQAIPRLARDPLSQSSV